jgi:hypothetical protein
MNINELTIGEFKQLTAMIGGNVTSENPFVEYLGKNVFIRSVTHHYTGRVAKLVGNVSCILDDAAWIADDGRFSDNLKSCQFDEVEPYENPVQINYGAVIDMTEIKTLPRSQK